VLIEVEKGSQGSARGFTTSSTFLFFMSGAYNLDMRILLLPMLIAGSLMACAPSSLMLEGRNLWTSKNLSTYSYTLQRSCFCPLEITKAMRLEVRDGALTSVKYVDSGADVPANFRPNIFKIEAFFDLIDSTRAKGGTVENLSFDAALGYPNQMNLDPIPLAVDDESYYKLSDLKVLGAPMPEPRVLWNSKNLSNYSYTLQRSCFCLPDYTKAIRLEVRGGALTSAKYVDSGTDVPDTIRPNIFKIESFFDLIDSTQAKGGKVDGLKFDAMLGYPTQMSLDPIPLAADDEISYKLSDLILL
jgi:Family of unknown function (DUF6174)